MIFNAVPLWKEAPFLRLIIPFAGGILLQWYHDIPAAYYWLVIFLSIILFVFFHYFRSFSRFRYYGVAGIPVHVLLLCVGGLLIFYQDIRHQTNWIGRNNTDSLSCIVTLEEPLSKKSTSYKAVASVDYISQHGHYRPAAGKLTIYFAIDSSCKNLFYHSRIAFAKPLQEIRNMGNPGGFDYKQYCAFQNIYHQVYLQPGEYIRLPEKNGGYGAKALFRIRDRIVKILHKNIREKESGLAEALLIGYKDDLDKELVQSYTNTGVVHIIAISGLHLGLIYWLLTQVFFFIRRLRKVRWLSPLLILLFLWTFSLLTGGSPSVMRSAVMFTGVIAGQFAGKKTSLYNSLAVSVFLLLCYNPFWLWDAGFQLSYLALLSIVIFMQPVYHWFYVTNKLLDGLLKMFSTTLAAQVLTAPISIFLFHQFPVYFILTNIVALPLSSLVVMGEIAVCACSWMPLPALGATVSWMISLMNRFIAYMEHLPFSMWSGLSISLLQTVMLYVIIVMLSTWWLKKIPRLLLPALALFLCFLLIRARSFVLARQQKMMIVYNIPKHQAIDLVSGRDAIFIADNAMQLSPALSRSNVQPAAIAYRFCQTGFVQSGDVVIQGFYFAGKKILLCSRFEKTIQPEKRIRADILVISGSPRVQMEDLTNMMDCRLVVFDSSNPAWKISQWTSACRNMGLPCYAVAEKGAFVFSPD